MASIGRTQQIGSIKRQSNTNVDFSRRELELYTIQELQDVLEYVTENGNRGARRISIFRAFQDKGIEFVPHEKMFIYCTGTFASGGNDGEEFDNSVLPELTFIEALNAIASIEPDAPEFDIKLRDEVLMYDYEGQTWELCDFARVAESFFYAIGYGFGACLIRYKGNEILHGKPEMPIGWWECENGKPVWRTK